jgi:SAM-dependent methyltransferase
MAVGGDWEREAENWVRWARTPMHDSYWYYRDSFFEKIVPPPGGRTIEVGCGEGRVSRDLRSRGHRVVAVDSSPTLLRCAREADPDGTYLIGDARALPFADASFDLAVAYNSLMDVDGMPDAVRESARVLVPGGYLCICVTHPLNDAGRFEGREPEAPFVIRGSYLGRRKFDERFERGGLEITFHGWCYPLEDYAIALEGAGFAIERLREPGANEETVAAGGPSELRWRRVPLFLRILARKR